MKQNITKDPDKCQYSLEDSPLGCKNRAWNRRFPHMFLPDDAKKYGVEAAIVGYAISELQQSCDSNNNIIAKDVPTEDLLIYCFYFTENQIRRAIEVLNKNGIVGNYND
jgi:hypothetical protein